MTETEHALIAVAALLVGFALGIATDRALLRHEWARVRDAIARLLEVRRSADALAHRLAVLLQRQMRRGERAASRPRL